MEPCRHRCLDPCPELLLRDERLGEDEVPGYAIPGRVDALDESERVADVAVDRVGMGGRGQKDQREESEHPHAAPRFQKPRI